MNKKFMVWALYKHYTIMRNINTNLDYYIMWLRLMNSQKIVLFNLLLCFHAVRNVCYPYLDLGP